MEHHNASVVFVDGMLNETPPILEAFGGSIGFGDVLLVVFTDGLPERIARLIGTFPTIFGCLKPRCTNLQILVSKVVSSTRSLFWIAVGIIFALIAVIDINLNCFRLLVFFCIVLIFVVVFYFFGSGCSCGCFGGLDVFGWFGSGPFLGFWQFGLLWKNTEERAEKHQGNLFIINTT
jgi:hypothetical protein